MSTVGNLVVNLGLNGSPFASGIKGARNQIGGLAGSVGGMVGGLAKMGAAGLVAGAALVGIGSVGAALTFGISAAAQAEQAQVAFTTIIGDAGVAKQTLADLSKFAAETPFETPELTNASRSLLAFGVGAEDIIPTLRAVGDISSGIGAPIEEIAELYGKAKVQGRLFAQDINQLTGRGIPVIQELSKQFGISDDKVKEMVESGKVNFGHLQKAFASLSGEGGKFGGMMAAQSATLSGQWSTFKDNIGLILRDIGEAFIEEFDFKGALGSLNDFAGSFRENWLPTIRGVIHAVAETFKGTVIIIGDLWRSWIAPAVTEISGFVSNLDLYWGIALQNVYLFAGNIGERFLTFFTNIGELLSWFGDNWKTVFADIGRLVMATVGNMGKNFGDFFNAVLDFTEGKGFNFRPTALTEGFKSELDELPKLTQAAIRDSTPELERLYSELGAREQAAKFAGMMQKMSTDAKPERTLADIAAGNAATANTGSKTKLAGAALSGTAEAFSIIATARARGSDPQAKIAAATNSMANTAKEQLIQTKKIAENTKEPAVDVVEIGS